MNAHIAHCLADEAERQDARDLEEFHSFMNEETQETFFASMLGDVQGGSDVDVAMADGSGSEEAPGDDSMYADNVPDNTEDIDCDVHINYSGVYEMDTSNG